MRAALYSRNGPARDVLQVTDLPTPEPAPGEVRVKLAVSGVNPSDVKSRAGSRPVTQGFVVPHSDGAGVIDRVGSGVAQGRVGERVWIWNGQWQRPMGTAAGYIVLPAAQAVPLPGGVSFEAGACMGIPGLTAMRGVMLLGDLAGKTVLVTGGASGVGYYAAQMARLRGARVITTVGSVEKAGVLEKAGIADNILYKQESVPDRLLEMTGGRGVDAIVDMDFSTTAALVPAGAVAPHGVIAVYGSNQRGDIPLNFGAWLPRSLSLHFYLVYDLLPEQRRQTVDALDALLRGNELSHLVAPAYPLDDIAGAHEAVESGRIVGNVVVALPA
ncbi:NADPH:quinone oxidoreductase [Bordetella genomosp. 8]|uniref:NADPH:quinone oxidoreductase n=1 Tax=Bordetella genomosp. 8 TaxID=1416806 RepID=A0A1W6YEB3_9BORD|nr:NADPH:quinone reductase [Bordetella genomosp. 8]ARP79378.1 NADPH:quinone oxidoreductase [Bordetella genomosp. 8]